MFDILVLGAGFAGLWAAIGAARKRAELGLRQDDLRITVVNHTPWHSIRVRNYEPVLADTIVPLASVLDPVGVRHIEAQVTDIDLPGRRVAAQGPAGPLSLPYDRLVFALGSRLAPAPVPGLAEHGFDIDTYAAATRLAAHLATLPTLPPSPARDTVLVIGAGLTGIEAATAMPGRLKALHPAPPPPFRVILADRGPWIGSDMGEPARAVIETALQDQGIETRIAVSIAAIDPDGATQAGGERIAAATVIWCAGLQAHPLTSRFPVLRDRLGRLPVDPSLRICGRPEFAAGDAATVAIDGLHPSVMSCQHARPMGRFAGHNVVCDLLGLPMLDLRIDWYATVLDLGPSGAVYTEGRDRHVVATGAEAQRTKQLINRQRIYPPRSGNPQDILDAAAPTVQTPPPRVAVPR